MAFRILTDEEKALLDEKQLEKYEEQLRLYQLRVDFVNQLERFENAEIKPYTVKKKTIKIAEKVQISEVKIPGTSVKTENKISEKLSEIRLLNKSDSERISEGIKTDVKVSNNSEKLYYIVKKCDGISGVKISADISSVNIERKNYSAPEISKASLPAAEIKNIPDILQADNKSVIKINIPETSVSGTGVPESIPVVSGISISMPEAGITGTGIAEKIPYADSRVKINIPLTAVGNINKSENIKIISAEFTAPEVIIDSVSHPEIGSPAEVKISMEKCSVSVGNIPEVNVPDVNTFKAPTASVNVPEIKNAVPVNVREFEKPELSAPAGIPDVPECKPVSIRIPVASVIGIPQVKIPDTDFSADRPDYKV